MRLAKGRIYPAFFVFVAASLHCRFAYSVISFPFLPLGE
jgi:hypothetical protein